jgi:D-alanyl-D-alanine carboxypeptidase
MASANKKLKPFPAPLPNFEKRPDPRGAAAKRLSVFAVAAVAAGAICFSINGGQARFADYLYAQISYPAVQVSIPAQKPVPKLEVEAKAAYSYRVDGDGRRKVIFEKNIDEKLPVASLTKLMTAIVVLENDKIYGLDNQTIIDLAGAGQTDVPIFGNLQAGEIYAVRRLLNLMLFYSSNDAAYSLAGIMGVDDFVAAMNQKARDLELKSTEFFNPNGLDGDAGINSSSAGDLAVLVDYVIKSHPEILNFSTQPGPYLTENGIFDLNFWDGQTLVGGKTGFTEKAGGCMIAVFQNQSGRRYVNILLGAVSPETRVVQMQKLINYANNFDK